MTNSFIYYVLESSVCLLLFLMVYRLLISNLTHFSWMRIYLLSSVILSIALPLLILPIHWSTSIHVLNQFKNWSFMAGSVKNVFHGSQNLYADTAGGGINWQLLIIAAYLSGLLYKTIRFAMNLRSIQKCIMQSEKVKDGRFWLVSVRNKVPPFSFFNYIFIAYSCQNLPQDDLQLIKNHEKIHAQQLHSFDVLFIEFVSIIFWFNPLMIYLKKSIQEIHEYIVDEKIADKGSKKSYAGLLLNLASDVKGFSLSAGFSGSMIKRRIAMIARQRSLPVYKLMFFILVPVTLFIMLSFSYIKNHDTLSVPSTQIESNIQNKLKIGNIIWKGNNVYDIKTLNQVFGLKPGSEYNQSLIDDRLNGLSGAQDAVANLYQDNGYLFSRITPSEIKNNETVDLTITIYEGKQAKFNEVIVKINGILIKDPVNEIAIHKGDLFSKAKIIKSVIGLAASGKYVPDKINPVPFPNVTTDKFDTVDILFELTTINN